MNVLGSELRTGMRVQLAVTFGVWVVLPPIPGDDLRYIGRTDYDRPSLVPIVPDELYDVIASDELRRDRVSGHHGATPTSSTSPGAASLPLPGGASS